MKRLIITGVVLTMLATNLLARGAQIKPGHTRKSSTSHPTSTRKK